MLIAVGSGPVLLKIYVDGDSDGAYNVNDSTYPSGTHPDVFVYASGASDGITADAFDAWYDGAPVRVITCDSLLGKPGTLFTTDCSIATFDTLFCDTGNVIAELSDDTLGGID